MAKAVAEEFIKSIEEGTLIEAPLKGKVDIKWFGHAGFKIAFKDELDI